MVFMNIWNVAANKGKFALMGQIMLYHVSFK